MLFCCSLEAYDRTDNFGVGLQVLDLTEPVITDWSVSWVLAADL